MRTIQVAAAVIFSEDGQRVFAAERGYGDQKGGWEFPGGKLEPGETAQEALVREIREELDTQIRVEEKLLTIRYDYPEFHLHMDCFRCRIESGTLQLKEAMDARWLDRTTLHSVNWLPADLEMVAMLENDALWR